MKIRSLICSVALLALLSLSVNAQQGGYKGPTVALVTVKKALTLKDDVPVVLKGKITQGLGGERYQFQDSTGTITVDIDGKVWQNLSVDQNDVVEISGEMDKEWNKIEVEVKSIRKL